MLVVQVREEGSQPLAGRLGRSRQVLAALGATGSLAGCLSRCHTPAEEIDVPEPLDLSDPFDLAGAWRMVDGDAARTGQTAWTMPANPARCWCDSLGTNGDEADVSRFLQGPPVVARGTNDGHDPLEPAQPYRVYVTATVWGGGGSWGTVHCLNAHTGAEHWRMPFRGEAAPPSAVAGDSLLAPLHNRLVGYGAETGAKRWHVAVPNADPAAVVEGAVFLPGDDANLVTVGPCSGFFRGA